MTSRLSCDLKKEAPCSLAPQVVRGLYVEQPTNAWKTCGSSIPVTLRSLRPNTARYLKTITVYTVYMYRKQGKNQQRYTCIRSDHDHNAPGTPDFVQETLQSVYQCI